MDNKTLPQITSLFQDFDRQIKNHEAQLAAAQQSSRQLRVTLRDIVLAVANDYKSLRQQ